MRENAGGNDTVPISMWRGKGMRSAECCCFVICRVVCGKVVGATSREVSVGILLQPLILSLCYCILFYTPAVCTGMHFHFHKLQTRAIFS